MNPNLDLEQGYESAKIYYDAELRQIFPNIKNHHSAVDIGSGYGYMAKYLLENGFSNVICVDTSKELLDKVSNWLGDKVQTYNKDAIEFLSPPPPTILTSLQCLICLNILKRIKPFAWRLWHIPYLAVTELWLLELRIWQTFLAYIQSILILPIINVIPNFQCFKSCWKPGLKKKILNFYRRGGIQRQNILGTKK